jgi:hypothetical protein
LPCLAGSLLAAPLWAAFILAEDPAVAAACLLGEYLTAECWFGPTVASIFGVVPKDKRGTVPLSSSSLLYMILRRSLRNQSVFLHVETFSVIRLPSHHIFLPGTAQGFFSVLTAAGNIAPVAVGAFAGEFTTPLEGVVSAY